MRTYLAEYYAEFSEITQLRVIDICAICILFVGVIFIMSVSYTVSEILPVIYENINGSRNHEHGPGGWP